MSKPRAYVGTFTIHFGPATCTGRLLPVRTPDRAPKLHYCTPTGEPVRQCYIDSDGKTYFSDELGRATMDEDGNLIPVDKDAVDQAKESDLPLNILNVTPHDRDDIDKFLFPSNNNAYIFDPVIKNGKKIVDDPVNMQWHDFINVIVRDSGAVFIGRCNMRNHEGLFRLSHYQGYLTVQKMLYPEDLNQYDPMHPELDPLVRDKALAVVKNLTQPFDPNKYNDVISERLIRVTDQEFDLSDSSLPVTSRPAEINLSDALDSFLV